jgi:UrcA family protein
MSRFTFKILVSCAMAGLFSSPLSALASMPGKTDELPSRVVEYGDLDLSRDSGVTTLYTRINSAARAVCEPLDVAMLKLLREKFDCRRDAIARAVSEVNSPGLTNYYVAKTGAIAGNQR